MSDSGLGEAKNPAQGEGFARSGGVGTFDHSGGGILLRARRRQPGVMCDQLYEAVSRQGAGATLDARRDQRAAGPAATDLPDRGKGCGKGRRGFVPTVRIALRTRTIGSLRTDAQVAAREAYDPRKDLK